jgi:hypothetical protein
MEYFAAMVVFAGLTAMAGNAESYGFMIIFGVVTLCIACAWEDTENE